MAARLPQGDDQAPMAEINVTPLVDVMLVLLVIFIVLAPVISQVIGVNLPKVEGRAQAPKQALDVELGADGQVRVKGVLIPQSRWEAWAKEAVGTQPDAVVRLWADGSLPFEWVAGVVSAFNRGGVQKLAFSTQQK